MTKEQFGLRYFLSHNMYFTHYESFLSDITKDRWCANAVTFPAVSVIVSSLMHTEWNAMVINRYVLSSSYSILC